LPEFVAGFLFLGWWACGFSLRAVLPAAVDVAALSDLVNRVPNFYKKAKAKLLLVMWLGLTRRNKS
jgi:hypothetical protein